MADGNPTTRHDDGTRRSSADDGPRTAPAAARGAPTASDSGDATTSQLAAAIRRVSWGAIFAGAVVALVIQLMLNLLGLSIGLGAIDPAAEQNPLSGLGTGAGIWLAVSAILALLAGGWTAGRLAGLPRRIDGILHGFVAWAVATFVTFYLVTSGVGTVLSGAFNIVEQGTQVVAQGVEAVAPEAGQAIQQATGDISPDEVRQEALAILRQTGQEELQPENLAQRAEQAGQTATEAGEEAAAAPADAEQEINAALDRLITQGEDVVDEVDRQAAVNVLTARTDMSEQEARNAVQQYEQVFQQAQTQIQQAAEDVGEAAPEVAGDVASAVSSAALWAFIAMFVGAVAAALGGAAGVPRDLPASPAMRRE